MKFFIYILFLFPIFLQAQKHDNNFVIGYYGITKPELGLTSINFNPFKIAAIPKKSKMDIDRTCSIISDKTGKLAFYTNGQHIENDNQDTVQNGLFFNQSDGFTILQGCLVLPFPEKDSMYLVMYQQSGFIPNTTAFGIKKFQYGVVDMSLNNGKGKMISKGFDVMPTDIYPIYGHLSAVKQANGKDWWIYTMQDNNKGFGSCNIFYRYQLTKDGFTYVDKQTIAKSIPDGVGTAVFSPDGKKYAIFNDVGPTLGRQLDVFDFDRCTGKFSNQNTINYTNPDYDGEGLSFSPNSQYLYAALNKYLLQYDMNEQDIKKSEKIIAKSKEIKTCLNTQTNFCNAQLAPNGKIYIAGCGCAKAYHIIHEPNKSDTLCNVEQVGLTLPTYYFASIPNFPNFQLGKMDCTVSASEAEEKIDISIYPNPTNGLLHLNIDIINPNTETKLIISDVTGSTKASFIINQQNNTFDVNNLANGLYICNLLSNNNVIYKYKLVILK
jgi:hypothetical protein